MCHICRISACLYAKPRGSLSLPSRPSCEFDADHVHFVLLTVQVKHAAEIAILVTLGRHASSLNISAVYSIIGCIPLDISIFVFSEAQESLQDCSRLQACLRYYIR